MIDPVQELRNVCYEVVSRRHGLEVRSKSAPTSFSFSVVVVLAWLLVFLVLVFSEICGLLGVLK